MRRNVIAFLKTCLTASLLACALHPCELPAQNAVDADVEEQAAGRPKRAAWTFDTGSEGWTGSYTAGISSNAQAWPGCIVVTPKVREDPYVYSPRIRLQADRRHVAHVRIFPLGSNKTVGNDLKIYWMSSAAALGEKQAIEISYDGRDCWLDLMLPIGQHENWAPRQITQLRLDPNQSYCGAKWIVDCFELNVNPPHMFDENAEGWTSGNGMSALTWADGKISARQTDASGQLFSPWILHRARSSDVLAVTVFAEAPTSGTHDMRVSWLTNDDREWNSEKSSRPVDFDTAGEWTEAKINIGRNPNWSNKEIVRMRLDFDRTDRGTRWLIERIDLRPGQ